MSAALEQLSSSKMFDGFNLRFRHQSATLGCAMTFSIYMPPSPASNIPVLYWLSGLTCNDENFIMKSGAQRAAAAHGIALVVPDTSPRGLNIEGESDSYDFGVGAGFYLNATNEKWKIWRMYDYVVKELPKVSVSAFAPIANPINCPWGQKAFSNYLGSTKSDWEEYDATCLIKKNNNVSTPILIDQGDADKFLAEQQLLPRNFEEACKAVGAPLILRMQPGYDHSYYFIATFVDDHIAHHAQFLKSA
ncbi:S-formylglutathione hydrolase-like isoform X3 [Miscanthus floridulus]|uniref:S-formylglutathione hydrolase-like isoform X3 n=1 Tax=Miscanthus floridulus TaxID=154761 RepID=UPI0034582F9A